MTYSVTRTVNNKSRTVHKMPGSSKNIDQCLEYPVTVWLLIFSSGLMVGNELAYSTIKCLHKESDDIDRDTIESYCWSAPTYSLSPTYLIEAGVEIPHTADDVSVSRIVYTYHNFYQYVPVIFAIQAALFSLPSMLWNAFRSKNELLEVIESYKERFFLTNEAIAGEWAMSFFNSRWGRQKSLSLIFLLCSALATFNVLLQASMLDTFYHGKLLEHVKLNYTSSFLSDPIQLFPFEIICHFRLHRPSGYIATIDYPCFLPANALSAKIYLVLWIWFILISLLSCLGFLRLLLCFVLPVHTALHLRKILGFPLGTFSGTFTRYVKDTAENVGDWFVLLMLKGSMSNEEFHALAERFKMDSTDENESDTALEKQRETPFNVFSLREVT